MSTTEKELKRYYRNISHSLSYPRERKKELLENLKTSISTYLSEHPQADISDIHSQFGSPDEIVNSFFFNEEERIQNKRINTYHLIRKWIMIILAVVIVGVLGFYIWGMVEVKSSIPSDLNTNITRSLDNLRRS